MDMMDIHKLEGLAAIIITATTEQVILELQNGRKVMISLAVEHQFDENMDMVGIESAEMMAEIIS